MAFIIGGQGDPYVISPLQISYNTPDFKDEPLLSRYPNVTTHCFLGVGSFVGHCVNRLSDFVDGSVTANHYVAFTGVSVDSMKKIESLREVGKSVPKMHFLYEAAEEVLIVKIMVSTTHDMAVEALCLKFSIKLYTLNLTNEIVSIGSGRIGDAGISKEADKAFKPLATRGDPNDWPSLVFEVGYAESLEMLRSDAFFWLTRSGERTRIVIIVHINKVARKIHLERWEVGISSHPRRVNVCYAPTVEKMQYLTLEEGVQYVGQSLQLPVAKVFDIVPAHILPHAFDITPTELQNFNDLYWQMS